jgi:hypothetical protein
MEPKAAANEVLPQLKKVFTINEDSREDAPSFDQKQQEQPESKEIVP